MKGACYTPQASCRIVGAVCCRHDCSLRGCYRVPPDAGLAQVPLGGPPRPCALSPSLPAPVWVGRPQRSSFNSCSAFFKPHQLLSSACRGFALRLPSGFLWTLHTKAQEESLLQYQERFYAGPLLLDTYHLENLEILDILESPRMWKSKGESGHFVEILGIPPATRPLHNDPFFWSRKKSSQLKAKKLNCKQEASSCKQQSCIPLYAMISNSEDPL